MMRIQLAKKVGSFSLIETTSILSASNIKIFGPRILLNPKIRLPHVKHLPRSENVRTVSKNGPKFHFSNICQFFATDEQSKMLNSISRPSIGVFNPIFCVSGILGLQVHLEIE